MRNPPERKERFVQQQWTRESYYSERTGGEAMVIELNTTSPASLRAVFRFGQSRQVWIELDMGFVGGDGRTEDHLAEVARIIECSRYQQRLDPACGDCDWHQVLNLIRRCHDHARQAAGQLITSIRIEDGASRSGERGNARIAGPHQLSLMLEKESDSLGATATMI